MNEAAAINELEHFAWVQAEYDDVRKQLVNHGVEFHDINDVEQWKANAIALWPDFAEMSGGKEWVEGVMRFQKTGSFK